jgi:hypothetical protein
LFFVQDYSELLPAYVITTSSSRAATAGEWNLDPTTLRRRFIGETRSIQEANTESRQKLTSMQEKALIEHVDKLTDRGIQPTPQILKNIAEELMKAELGHN